MTDSAGQTDFYSIPFLRATGTRAARTLLVVHTVLRAIESTKVDKWPIHSVHGNTKMNKLAIVAKLKHDNERETNQLADTTLTNYIDEMLAVVVHSDSADLGISVASLDFDSAFQRCPVKLPQTNDSEQLRVIDELKAKVLEQIFGLISRRRDHRAGILAHSQASLEAQAKTLRTDQKALGKSSVKKMQAAKGPADDYGSEDVTSSDEEGTKKKRRRRRKHLQDVPENPTSVTPFKTDAQLIIEGMQGSAQKSFDGSLAVVTMQTNTLLEIERMKIAREDSAQQGRVRELELQVELERLRRQA